MKKTKVLALVLTAVIFALALASCGFSNQQSTDKEPCTHTYMNGVCTKCNEECRHSYAEGICYVCGYVCSHSFSDGKCTVCRINCAHEYENGKCKICNVLCSHEFESGVCKTCGFEDPDYIPEDGGRSLYDDIIEDYIYLIKYKYNNEELPPKEDNAPYYTDTLYEVGAMYTPSMDIGYAYKDIDGDGYVELMLVGMDSRIYALFTITDKAPAAVHVFQSGMGYLAPDGMIFYNTYGTDSKTGYYNNQKNHTYLVDGALVGTSYGYNDTDGDINTNGDEVYFTIDKEGKKTEITKSEYQALGKYYEHFWSYSTRLTKLSGYRYFPALLTATDTNITADFSSYAAILNTLMQMKSEVAGGSFVRSYWTSGKYNLGMIFKSDADFAIYDRLLGACVLVDGVSSRIGSAEKDLNGDGVNELVILDSGYRVLAIFTTLNGKPVLLDSYYDLRSAFIDAEGNIHVRQRILPGNEDDCEYFVYEITDGKLEAKVAIGVKYDKDGTANSRYKVVNGEKVDITADEYNALYTEYLADIGTTEFHTYTKKNSGLTFTQATA